MSGGERFGAASVVLGLFVAGCGLFQSAPAKTTTEEPKPESASSAVAEAPPETSSTPKEEPPPANLAEAMAPPSGLFDLRPIFGTDASTEKPAVFATVNAGMKAKELDATFPGLSKVVTAGGGSWDLANDGKKWVYYRDVKKPKELLAVNTLDDGGLWRLDYTFDSAVVSDDFWMYAQTAAKARWGKPRGEIGPKETLVSFKPKTLRVLTLHRDGDKVRLEVDLRAPK